MGITREMLTLEDALARLLGSVQPLEVEDCSLAACAGRFVAQAVVSKLDLPGFDNSAMDGYAVRAADVPTASPDRPVALTLVGRLPAGEWRSAALSAGECVRVFTGSPLPPGADAVVMQEDVRIDPGTPDRVSVLDPVKPWDNVRFKGEDVKRDSVLLQRGDRIHPTGLGLLAATGVAGVPVHRRPRIAVLASGNELHEPGTSLPAGGIYESNRLSLAAALRESGAEPVLFPRVPDSLEATVAALREGFDRCDVVITSGGVSVGELDYLKPAFQKMGGSMEFWKVALKPGKPFVHGRWVGKHWFGLPGNPVSAWVTFLLLVRPAVLAMQGAADTALFRCGGTLREAIRNSGDRRHFVRVVVDGEGNVVSAGRQGSHCQGSLASANALLDVAPGETLAAGSQVRVWCFPSGSPGA